MKKIIMIVALTLMINAFASFEFDGWTPKMISTGGNNLTMLSADTFFTNPGMLAYFDNVHVGFYTSRLYGISELENMSVLFIKPYRNFTLGVGMTTLGSHIYREQQLQLGAGFNIGDNLGFGIKGKYLSVVIDEIGSASTWALDIGIKYIFSYNLKFGARLKNVSQPFIGEEYILRDIAVGVQYIPFSLLKLYLNAVKTIPPSFVKYTYGMTDLTEEEKQGINDNIWDVTGYNNYLKNFHHEKIMDIEYHLGLEYQILSIMVLTGGLKFLHTGRISYSMGMEIYSKGIGVNYCFDIHSELGATHYFSVNLGQKEFLKKLSVVKGKIDINRAGVQEFRSLPGIGIKMAQEIVAYREKYNGFKKLEEIMNVRRIGPKTFEKIKKYIFITPIDDISLETEIIEEDSIPAMTIDINRATKKQLMAIPRIGEEMANKIIEYRKLHGGFVSVEEIKYVERIGERTYDQIKDYLKCTQYDPIIDEESVTDEEDTEGGEE